MRLVYPARELTACINFWGKANRSNIIRCVTKKLRFTQQAAIIAPAAEWPRRCALPVPGLQTLSPGVYTANIDSIPLIAITGQAATSQLGKDAFQCVDIAAIAAPVVKAAWCVTDKSKLAESFKCVQDRPRREPGPVLIDLPLDIQMPNRI